MRIVFFALWLPVALVASLIVARLAWRETRTLVVAVLAALVAAAGLVAFPRAVVDTIRTARTDRSYDITQSRQPDGGVVCLAGYISCVNERVWIALRDRIPPHDTYYVQTGKARVLFYTFTSLLPRIAVDDPRDADYVISYRQDPHSLPVSIAKTWNLGRASTTKSEREPLLLAKVKR